MKIDHHWSRNLILHTEVSCTTDFADAMTSCDIGFRMGLAPLGLGHRFCSLGPPRKMLHVALTASSIFYHYSRQSLRILHVHCLHIAVQLLFRTLLIISLSRYPHAQSVWHTLDTRLPDFLVELRVKADVFGSLALGKHVSKAGVELEGLNIYGNGPRTIAFMANPRISLIALGALFLNATPCTWTKIQGISLPS